MLWVDWVTALGAELAMSQSITAPTTANPAPTIPDFGTILPRAVEFTELMMLRDGDLDFLQIRALDATTQAVAGSRTLVMPTSIIVPFELNLITPAGVTPANGTRNPVQRTSIEWISMLYPTEQANNALPVYWALTDNNLSITPSLQVRLGPAPDTNYTAEWYGQTRPAPLSPANTSNFLSVNLPDLYLAASMIFMSGYQRNFGAQSDDPKMALSWMQVYEGQKKGAAVEQARLKAQGASWTAYAPTPIATPPRM